MKKYLYNDLYNLEERHWWHINKRELSAQILTKFLLKKNLKLLDVGCGTGKNMEFFKFLGQVWGVDHSEEALRFCHKRGLEKIKKGLAEDLPFKKGFFDLLTMFDVLEHTDDEKAMKEVTRVLKDKGFFLITVPAFNWLWSQWDIALHHKRRYSKKNLINLLEKYDFKIMKISYVYSFLILPILFIRLLKSIIYKKIYPSDFKLSNKFLNSFMLSIAKLESKLLLKSGVPIGTSIICLAKRK